MINPYQANLRAAWLFQASMRPPLKVGALALTPNLDRRTLTLTRTQP